MKLNDTFEQKFGCRTIRFQLVALGPCHLAIQTLDTTPSICRSGRVPSVALPKAALATFVDGEYITNEFGDAWVGRFANDIHDRLKARSMALKFLSSKNTETDEAEAIVERLDRELNHWEVKYTPALIRWIHNGEIDLENESDVKRIKRLLLSFFSYCNKLENGMCECHGYTLVFDDICFKRMSAGQPAICLRTMNEVEEALRPWTNEMHFKNF